MGKEDDRRRWTKATRGAEREPGRCESESEVAQSCLTFCNLMTHGL